MHLIPEASTVMLRAALLLPLLIGVAPALASDLTARASARIEIRTAPREWAPIVGYLAKNERVKLDLCTREAVWCRVVRLDGEPGGWVEGSWLVGSPAKVEVTPFSFSFDPMNPLGHRHGDPWPFQ